MKEVLILYIIISYPIVIGYTIIAVNYEDIEWSNSKDKLLAVFGLLFSPILLLVLLGSLLYKKIKE